MALRNVNGLYNNPNPYVEIKEPPPGLVALRTELAKPENADILKIAAYETTIEGSLATIAEKLGIIVDGVYDMHPLCEMLTKTLKDRHKRIITL